MTRRGKIARLPKEVRDELNQRLQNGEAGTQLIEWLNGLKKVQAVLKADFDGRPINDQNLSEWRAGGYSDWERVMELQARAQQLQENSAGLEEAAGGAGISNYYSTLLAVKITELADALLEKETDPEKQWERICNVNREISRLRWDDDQRARTKIRQKRWELEEKEIETERGNVHRT
jgi:hypothetical protein